MAKTTRTNGLQTFLNKRYEYVKFQSEKWNTELENIEKLLETLKK